MNKFYSALLISGVIMASAAQAASVKAEQGQAIVDGSRTLTQPQSMDVNFDNPLQVQVSPGDQARITCDNGDSFLFQPENPIETVLVLRNNNDCLAAFRVAQNTGGLLMGNAAGATGGASSAAAGGGAVSAASSALATAGFVVAGVATAAAVACAAGACGDSNSDVSPD